MNQQSFWWRTRAFWLAYGFVLVAAGIWQILYRQGIILLTINQHFSPWADVFFKYFTHLGDGLFCVLLAIVVGFWSKNKGIMIGMVYGLSGIVAQALKHLAFEQEPRPAEYFAGMMQHLHTVSGVSLSHWQSFPSGHTTSAFAVFGLLALWSRVWWQQIGFLSVAALIGYSRVYLMQHFLIDVYAGSVIGVATALGIYLYAQKRVSFNTPLEK